MRAIFLRAIHHRGVQVLLMIFAYFLFADRLPLIIHQALYGTSLFIKDVLLWLLPLTVGLFIAHTISSFERRAPLLILALLIFEGLSNLSSVWYAYGVGHIAAYSLPSFELTNSQIEFTPLWRFPWAKPIWWSPDKGTLIGLILGFFGMATQKPAFKQWIETGKDKAQWVLTHVFARLIPLFVLGFVARMYQTGMLNHLFTHYGALLGWLILFLSLYLILLFWISSDGSFKDFCRNIKNLLPAGGIAFTSGCSLSTMPWTISGAGKNLKDPQFAKAIIPATTNIQQIGDCIANTFLCFLLYTHFQGHCPDFFTWLSFSFVFMLARFATAAVLGGAIFIMLPIYEAYLGFNAEMMAIILAFNVVLDPLITCANVVANGALCRIFEKVWIRLVKTPHVVKEE